MQVEPVLAAACDCHVHVVGPLATFPQSATRSYTAAEAPLEALQSLGAPHGVNRFVLVQTSFYDTDNSCLLAALQKLGDRGRAVVAIDSKYATPSLLEEYENFGVRGLRVNLYSKSLLFAPDRISHLVQTAMGQIPSRRWHVEVIAPVPLLLNASKIIADSRIPVVLDHYALAGNTSPESSDGRRLLELIALPHVWVKLTAPYRITPDPLATKPPADWLAALLQAAPARCLWGSDWPHTPLDADQKSRDEIALYRNIAYSGLFQDFVQALPNTSLARRVLVENPQRLYGFGSA